MIARCYDRNHPAYARYGARGIKVCRRWRLSVAHFVNDMGPPGDEHVIARISQKGDYKPSNCQWLTKPEALVRSGRITLIEYQGERLSIPRWAKRLGVSHQTLYYRLRRCRERGLDLAVAIAKSPKRRKQTKG